MNCRGEEKAADEKEPQGSADSALRYSDAWCA
jgi:hypothetical protein